MTDTETQKLSFPWSLFVQDRRDLIAGLHSTVEEHRSSGPPLSFTRGKLKALLAADGHGSRGLCPIVTQLIRTQSYDGARFAITAGVAPFVPRPWFRAVTNATLVTIWATGIVVSGLTIHEALSP